VKLIAVAAAAVTLSTPAATAVSFVQAHQLDDGSFAERAGSGSPQLTAWAVLGLRAGAPVSAKTVRWLLARQNPAGGWGWNAAAADSNDTAAVVEALAAAGTRGRPIRRALAFLRSYYSNRDGGFALTPGSPSDAQSTAWVIQAFIAAGKAAPGGSLRYLRRLQRADGSFRYSARYTTTPVWVTSQVLPALARKAFPLLRQG
jgi:squalene-hopene/tetraprenyl-beta-curcumene cyclase